MAIARMGKEFLLYLTKWESCYQGSMIKYKSLEFEAVKGTITVVDQYDVLGFSILACKRLVVMKIFVKDHRIAGVYFGPSPTLSPERLLELLNSGINTHLLCQFWVLKSIFYQNRVMRPQTALKASHQATVLLSLTAEGPRELKQPKQGYPVQLISRPSC